MIRRLSLYLTFRSLIRKGYVYRDGDTYRLTRLGDAAARQIIGRTSS